MSSTARRDAVHASGPIEVMIVCRAELLLLGLERLLVQSPELRVFTYSRLPGNGGRRLADVAILSDRGDPDAVGQCRRLLESFADSVVLLSSKPDPSVLLGCMGEGARSFVMEGDPPDVLFAAIRAASRGTTYLGPRTLDFLVDWLAHGERSEATRRQRRLDDDLLRLLAQGRTTEEIAAALGIAPKTVRNRASRLYRRLGVHSRAAAVRLAEQRGLIR